MGTDTAEARGYALIGMWTARVCRFAVIVAPAAGASGRGLRDGEAEFLGDGLEGHPRSGHFAIGFHALPVHASVQGHVGAGVEHPQEMILAVPGDACEMIEAAAAAVVVLNVPHDGFNLNGATRIGRPTS